jgi:hypothetical protein
MSMRDVLATTLDAVQDPVIGIAAQMDAILAALPTPGVRTAFAFGKWALRNELRPAHVHQLVVSPASGADETKLQEQLHRDGVQAIQASFEAFTADQDELQDTIVVAQLALLRVLDSLVEYSDAHVGTIIEVIDPVETTYGEYEGGPNGATTGGFVSRFNVRERGAL